MKISILPLLVGGVAALFVATPLAIAQPVDTTAVVRDHGNWTLRQREDWLRERLDSSRRDGLIDEVEFDRVRHEVHDIRADEDRMRDHHDGQLTDNETRMLEARLDTVADRIHWLRQNNFSRPW
jgi:hypothetical protein